MRWTRLYRYRDDYVIIHVISISIKVRVFVCFGHFFLIPYDVTEKTSKTVLRNRSNRLEADYPANG